MDEHDVRIGIRVHTNRGVGEVVWLNQLVKER